MVGILNARELLSTYLAALKQEQQRLDRLLEGEQARHLRQMAHYLPDAVCTAGPMRISGGHPVQRAQSRAGNYGELGDGISLDR